MANNYIFSLTPTFTQGLVLGQLSILLLLALILKYLFFDSAPAPLPESQPLEHAAVYRAKRAQIDGKRSSIAGKGGEGEAESAEWFNMLLRQVLDAYRSKLRDDLPGPEGDQIARRRIEEFANQMRPAGFLDPIRVHSVDLGVSAPRLSNGRMKHHNPHKPSESETQAEFDLHYTDTVSISLSTACLLNYPVPAFARLPISLVISLSLFSCPITLTPPNPTHAAPTLTISLPTNAFANTLILNLTTKSLMGSRAKLSDVPKIGELIEMQVRRLLAERGTWKVVLPGLSSVQEAKEEIRKENMRDEEL